MPILTSKEVIPLLERALQARTDILRQTEISAYRLFNGFLEGFPELALDRYGDTLVAYNHASQPAELEAIWPDLQFFLISRLPKIQTVVLKSRNARLPLQRQGVLTLGSKPDKKVSEFGMQYAVDLTMNQDASFYPDTRILRRWLLEHATGWNVLNTFAYTGALGVAARAGGAAQAVQVDLNGRFLDLARRSMALNQLPVLPGEFCVGDFFLWMGRFRHSERLFDCAIVDPPFFSSTRKGRVDLVHESKRILNKVRPLVRDGGYLVTINNALFLSGAEYMTTLEDLCADGYLSIEELIPVPEDITGFPETRTGELPADPAPFNHSTKIAILKVKRK